MHRVPPALAPAVSLAVIAAALTGCSDDGTVEPVDPPSASATVAEDDRPPLATRATVRTVSGSRLAPRARARLRTEVTSAVDRWFEAAYLGGPYPRTDFADAFPVFTRGARARARDDRNLMSNAGVGVTTYAVRATARRVAIDVLADRGRASAVTVQFRLGMARAGETGAEVVERVAGRLFLTSERRRGWRVFGYDVERGRL